MAVHKGSNADTVRNAIRALNGRDFTSKNLPKVKGVSGILFKMCLHGEIECTRTTRDPITRGRLRVYRELDLKGGREQSVQHGAPPPDEPWADVWPEFFQPPAFTGRRRAVTGAWDDA